MTSIELGTYLRGNGSKYHDCIEACVACLVACEACSDACLSGNDVAMMLACIRLDRDCADACAASIRVMIRGGPLTVVLPLADRRGKTTRKAGAPMGCRPDMTPNSDPTILSVVGLVASLYTTAIS